MKIPQFLLLRRSKYIIRVYNAMKGIILLDLDETLHYSAKIKQKAWQHVLNFFGYEWTISSESPGHELDGIESKNWPRRGLSPRKFIKELLQNLGLSLNNFNSIGDAVDIASEEQLLSFLEQEWSKKLIEAAKETRMEEVPGAVDMVKKLYTEGYRMGVVTQAPTEYARVVLGKLGLIEDDNSFISAVVGGDMVSYPKPDPEPLFKAVQSVYLNEIKLNYPDEEIPVEEFIIKRNIDTVALIGDSQSDIDAGANFGIPVLMIDEIMQKGQLDLPDGAQILLEQPTIRGERSFC